MAGGGGERDADEETRNQMMQNLFGDQSEDEDDADDDDGQQQQLQSPPHHHHEIEDDADEDGDDARSDAPARHGGYHSEEVDGEAENGGEGEGESEGQVEMEEESEGEAHRADLDQGESDGDKVHSSPERELDDQRMESDAKGLDSEDEGYQQRTVSSRRRGVVASESEGSEDNYYADGAQEDEEPRQTRKQSSPMEEERDHEVVRDVFGDSDEDEPAPYRSRHEIDEESHRSPMEDEDQYEKDMQPDDTVADEDMRYESDENRELKPKEKPVGPPLDLVVPFKQPPARPDKMNVIKVSNIMGIDPKPFDPKTYVEEDVFVTDESGTKKRIRLEDNIVRWRTIRNADGTTSCESNARFVKWKDGSMQLLIGNEVLDISVHEAHHDQSHLFLRHGKGILQSQGRLLHKMRFMPSSLFSKSHRLLTALVDSQNKKTVKMQKWFETKDPEKAKMEKERIQGQNIRAHSILQRKREKVNRKYTQPARPRRQLSPGFLEDALDESNVSRNVPRKPPYPPARLPRRQADEYSESEREESEYETDGEDIEHSPPRGREDELDEEEEYEEEVEEEAPLSDEEMEAPKRKRESGGGGGHMREELASEDDESPPRKQPTVQHRRKAVVFDDSDED
ncbi:Protein LEO1 [Zea mays]|uniref:Protein LEO1 n=1 Tax=Zea mays TaxID=4577 RepID=A0A3L6DWH8_MAIZE|nr:Protein LEO1 [Zea mays]